MLDTATGDLLDTVPAGGRPKDLFVDQQSGLAFVLNAGYGAGTSSFFATASIPPAERMGSAAHTPWWQAITQALPWNTLRATPTPDIAHATVSVLDASR